MRDNSRIWQLCLDTLEKQDLPEERKIDKVIMESVFRNAQKIGRASCRERVSLQV